MAQQQTRSIRRSIVIINYLCLIITNVCFYLVYHDKEMTHLVDAAGLLALLLVVITFIRMHLKSGLWKLTHTNSDQLDERELQVTHSALCLSYSYFTVICLSIMLIHAILFRFIADINLVITLPLVVSLIYFAHSLPASILAWTENKVPGDAV